MARSDHTPVTPLGPFGTYSAEAADVVPAALTGSAGSSGDQFVASGNDLVIAEETGGGAQTITFSSVTDPFGRTGDITAYSIGANEFAVFGPFKVIGWRQTDYKIYLLEYRAGEQVMKYHQAGNIAVKRQV